MASLKIGMVGLDTSHCTAFTRLLNDPEDEFHVPGGRVTVAYPGGSPDFELSWSRVEGITAELRENYDVRILSCPEEVAEQSDAILLTAVDGRCHRELFRRIAPYKKPVFIDKPFAVSTRDAREMVRIAEEHQLPLMSASSLRYAEPLVKALEDMEQPFGCDAFGPMALEPTQPGLFWYGIHGVEMMYAALGTGCVRVRAVSPSPAGCGGGRVGGRSDRDVPGKPGGQCLLRNADSQREGIGVCRCYPEPQTLLRGFVGTGDDDVPFGLASPGSGGNAGDHPLYRGGQREQGDGETGCPCRR